MINFWLNFQSEAGQLASSLFSSITISRGLSLTLISILLGVVFVYLYSFVSFQTALANLKKKIFAVALEPFLFRDSLLLSITSPLRVFALGLKYLALCLPPLIILALPMLWILGFLNQAYGYRELVPGDKVFISISANSAKEIRALDVTVELQGAELSTLVKSPVQNQAFAELKIQSKNPQGSLQIKGSKQNLTIPLANDAYAIPIITNLAWKKLLFPAARLALPEGISEVELQYPAKHFEVLAKPVSLSLHWLVLFGLVSIVSGLGFAKYAGVEV